MGYFVANNSFINLASKLLLFEYKRIEHFKYKSGFFPRLANFNMEY